MSRATTLLSLFLFVPLVLGAFPENLAAQTSVNVTTWQQDSAASSICTGCVYRTGQNLSESKIDNTISKTNFGQFCNYLLDGEVYGQPLVVTNVKFQNVAHTVVYVVTMNDSVYAFDGAPPSPTSNGCTLLAPKVQLFPSGSNEVAVDCTQVGGKYCLTIAPKVGILGTPVISTRILGDGSTGGALYAVAESQSSNGLSFYHRLWALDITSLSPIGGSPISISPSGTCPADSTFSQKHIQRPALLLAGDNYLYIAFSMMDGYPPTVLPNGMIFAFNTANLNSSLCLATSSGISGSNGGGIWGGGGGPSYGPDANTGTNSRYYTFFNTANGQFGSNSNYGDSFIKLYNTGSALQVSDYFAPGDQYSRSNSSCGGDGDTDFGSGSPMLIPDRENSSYPFLAVSGDKEGGIWFMDRTLPHGTGSTGSTSCTNNSNNNVQTFAINGSGNVGSGPVIHTNPAFWETSGNEQTATNYLFMGSQFDNTNQGAGLLMRYQICDTGNPINSVSPCSMQGAFAYDTVSTNPVVFPWGTTPTISAVSDSASDSILWAIWADGSLVNNSQTIIVTEKNGSKVHVPPAQSGVLYAFDAANSSDQNMKKLYGSNDCVINGSHVDQILPAAKYSVPTVANGYVYMGALGPSCNAQNLYDSCFNAGTFYIFGKLPQTRNSCN